MARGPIRPPRAAAPSTSPEQRAIARDPSKAVIAPPRLKPVSTREYGKGGTPLSGAPSMGVAGAGIGYGGPRGV
jgi:hypothetical protein